MLGIVGTAGNDPGRLSEFRSVVEDGIERRPGIAATANALYLACAPLLQHREY